MMLASKKSKVQKSRSIRILPWVFGWIFVFFFPRVKLLMYFSHGIFSSNRNHSSASSVVLENERFFLGGGGRNVGTTWRVQGCFRVLTQLHFQFIFWGDFLSKTFLVTNAWRIWNVSMFFFGRHDDCVIDPNWMVGILSTWSNLFVPKKMATPPRSLT